MRYVIRFLLLLCITGFWAAVPASARTITLATLEWEPYIGPHLPGKGYVAEVVNKALKGAGYEVQLDFYPWARAIHLAENGSIDGYVPEYYSDSLDEHFYISDPFPGGDLVFFKRTTDSISYKTLQDLKPYVIGVVRGYVNTEEFDNASYLQIEEVMGDQQNFQKLLQKRIDLVVADRNVGLWLLKKKFPKHTDRIDIVDLPLDTKTLHLCISKSIPDGQEIIRAFNDALATMVRKGVIDELRIMNGLGSGSDLSR